MGDIIKLINVATYLYIIGDRVEDVCPEIFAELKNYKTVVLQYGTNNIPRERPSVTEKKFESLIQNIRRGKCACFKCRKA